MLVAIRDDDTCYFTRPEQLKSVYQAYWDVCPVTLSVIPYVDTRHITKPPVVIVPQAYKGQVRQYPVGENRELITYLKEQLQKQHIGISMHGYCHLKENGIAEFESDNDFFEKVQNGKQYLESLFGFDISVFTPPNNSLSRSSTAALSDSGFNIVMAYGFYPWERPLNYNTTKSFIRLLMHYFQHKRSYPYPGILNCGTHKEHACVVVGTFATVQQLKENFYFLQSKNANMCLATHYADLYYMPEYRNVFHEFLDYLTTHHREEIEFVTADKLFCPEN